jgi:hypothetical protein
MPSRQSATLLRAACNPSSFWEEFTNQGVPAMAKRPDLPDLQSAGVRELLRLTNEQFEEWKDSLSRETNEPIGAGSLMNYWFILSNLALHGDSEFLMNKKDTFLTIPNLKPEAVRNM